MKHRQANPAFAAGKKQKGYSLVELLAGMVIIVLLLAGVFALFNGGLAGGKSIVHNQQLTGLIAGVKGIYTSPAYTGISANQIITAGKAPTNMVVGAGAAATLNNPWGGGVTIASGNFGAGTNNAFVISDAQVPTAECNTVVSGVGPSFVKIAVGATVVKDDSAGTTLTTANVVTACAAAGSNTVVFTAT